MKENKNLFLIMIVLIFLLPNVIADIAIVAEFPNDIVEVDCLRTKETKKASEAIGLSKFVPEWSEKSIFGRLLCKLNNFGEEPDGQYCEFYGDYWAFHINEGNGWEFSSVGLDFYDAQDESIIGLKFGDGSETPQGFEFEEICFDEPLIINKVRAFINDDNENLVSGEDLQVKPGDKIEIEIGVGNFEAYSIDLFDVEVELEIDDLDINEDDSLGNLKPGGEEKSKIKFKIPLNAEEDDYDLVILIEGEGDDGFDHVVVFNIVVEVEREEHDLFIDSVQDISEGLGCENEKNFEAIIQNKGESDEENVILIVNSSEINYNGEFVIDNLKFGGEEKLNFLIGLEGMGSGNFHLTLKAYNSELELEDTEILKVDRASCEKFSLFDKIESSSNNEKIILNYHNLFSVGNEKTNKGIVLYLILSSYFLVIFLGVFFVLKVRKNQKMLNFD